jgi:hypothetical protein
MIYLNMIPKEVYIYILCAIVHFITPHLYVHFCTPATWKGFFLSQFMVIAPHCQSIRWSIGFSGLVLNNIWVFLISWFVAKIIKISTPFSKIIRR